MELFPSSLIMATHYPLAHRDLLHAYPEPEVFRVDMDPNAHHDFATAKPLAPQHNYAPPAEYTSSPDLDSQTDDDPSDRVFDVDLEYAHAVQQQQQQQQQLRYDPASSPSWAAASTPRAWMGEPHKLPSLDPDSRRSSFAYPTVEGGVAHHQQDSSNSSSSSVPFYNLADYLENPSPAHSPPTSYLPTPASIGGLGAAMGPSYYAASSPEVHAQHSPYTLSARYNSSLHGHNPGCDPRFVSPGSGSPHAGPSSSPQHQDVGISFADVYTDPSQGIVKVEQDQQSIGIGPATVLHPQQGYESDSGEDEKSEDEDDPSYVVPSSRSRPSSLQLPMSSRSRPRNVRSSSTGSATTIGMGGDPMRSQRPTRTPAPEPVPNLTKKSRGRRVPTAASLYSGYSSAAPSTSGTGVGTGGKNARTYVCKVKDCGKCFARSEHLKRHVRSIHTNEKPHRCPHPGCSKEFSRHDNLCQHMRVHRNFSAPKDGAFGSF